MQLQTALSMFFNHTFPDTHSLRSSTLPLLFSYFFLNTFLYLIHPTHICFRFFFLHLHLHFSSFIKIFHINAYIFIHHLPDYLVCIYIYIYFGHKFSTKVQRITYKTLQLALGPDCTVCLPYAKSWSVLCCWVGRGACLISGDGSASHGGCPWHPESRYKSQREKKFFLVLTRNVVFLCCGYHYHHNQLSSSSPSSSVPPPSNL